MSNWYSIPTSPELPCLETHFQGTGRHWNTRRQSHQLGSPDTISQSQAAGPEGVCITVTPAPRERGLWVALSYELPFICCSFLSLARSTPDPARKDQILNTSDVVFRKLLELPSHERELLQHSHPAPKGTWWEVVPHGLQIFQSCSVQGTRSFVFFEVTHSFLHG